MESHLPSGANHLKNTQAIRERRGRMQLTRPWRTAQILLVALSVGICDQNYWQYSNVDRYWPEYWLPFVHGIGLAPEQYRIGVKLAAWWMVQHLHLGFRHGFTIMDTVSLTVAMLLTCNLLQTRQMVRQATNEMQWFTAAAFFALAAYYLGWVGFFFRPETLPSVGLTAVMAWFWTSGPKQSRANYAITISVLILAAAAQAWIRADIPCALNAGILLISITRYGHNLALPRRVAMVTAAGCIGIAAGIQIYIMRVMYPHASYGPIPVVMIAHDFHQWPGLPPFLVFMLPVAWTAIHAWRERENLDGPSLGLLLGAGIYFLLWIVLGKIDEVRIFIPFALILAPISADLALRKILGNSHTSAEMIAEGKA